MNVVNYSCVLLVKYIRDRDWNFSHNLYSIISCCKLDQKTYISE